MECKYLVIDTWLLEKASEKYFDVIELLARIARKSHKIILDYDGEILSEYSSHIESGGMSGAVFEKCSREAKITYKPIADISSRIEGVPVDSDDRKFLGVTVNSPHRIFVTGEPKLLRIKEQLEERLNIKIIDINVGLHEIE